MFTDVRVQKLTFKAYTFFGSSKVYTLLLKNSLNTPENICIKKEKQLDILTEVSLTTITKD